MSCAAGYTVEVIPASAWPVVVAAALVERLRTTPTLRVCLPTGATPVPVYDELVGAEHRGEVSLAAATVVLLDEWLGLPPGDPARCDVRLRAGLIDRLRVRPAWVPIEVDGPDPHAAAARHDAASRDLDLAVVGIGPNGHVGFNEPGSGPDAPTRVVELAPSSRAAARERYDAAAVPTGGVTVGLARLLEARECWLLVTGSHKAAVLHQALEGPESPACPASFLRRHPRLVVFADDAAAGTARTVP